MLEGKFRAITLEGEFRVITLQGKFRVIMLECKFRDRYSEMYVQGPLLWNRLLLWKASSVPSQWNFSSRSFLGGKFRAITLEFQFKVISWESKFRAITLEFQFKVISWESKFRAIALEFQFKVISWESKFRAIALEYFSKSKCKNL